MKLPSTVLYYGELLKKDEEPINKAVQVTRQQLYQQPFSDSLFDAKGALRADQPSLAPIDTRGEAAYIDRYLGFFEANRLQGLKLLHSAVGRDLLVKILESLGAQVTPAGRSDSFVPIDTEAIDQAQLDTIQALCEKSGGGFDAVLSTDGDSDRPLLVSLEGKELSFHGGDLLGMIVAEYLGADGVVVPISTNDAIDRGSLAQVTEPKTRIGSPWVIAGMQHAVSTGRRRVCGWEANGGFLIGTDIELGGKILKALPTRDAVLPQLCALIAAKKRDTTLTKLFATLPKRFSRSSLIRKFPQPASVKIVARFLPPKPVMQDISYENDIITAAQSDGTKLDLDESETQHLSRVRQELETVFSPQAGFTRITHLNYIDSVRITLANGDVAHFRPSGNADKLRIYAVADTQERANEIAEKAIAEPNGLLRQLEAVV